MKSRLNNALEVRTAAAELAAARPHPTHYSNGDEGRFRFENVPDVTDPRHGNAPTYIGNSGGGIFDAESHELLGIFSKIYTHGNLRPTVVPHMGLVTPLQDIYAWCEEIGCGVLLEE